MDLLSTKIIKEILFRYDAAPRKRLGQNFLINAGIRQKIIAASNLDRGNTVLEIGPGLGALTQELAKQAGKVVAIEKDRKFVEILKETLAEYKNVEIIQNDIMKLEYYDIEKLNSYKIIANLPYYITSPVIRKFLEAKNQPKEMILMVQKEVAQRICALPPDMSLLAVSVQFYAEPKIISYVSGGSFWPSPKVDSAILRLVPRAKYQNINIAKFFQIVHAGFSAPRKQLANNLSKKLKLDRQTIKDALQKAKIEPTRRAETLGLDEWLALAEILKVEI